MKRLLLGLLVALAAFSASAYSQEECAFLAESMYNAQRLMNVDPNRVREITAEIAATPAEEMGIGEDLKNLIVTMAGALKEGQDPVAVGNSVFAACKSIKGT